MPSASPGRTPFPSRRRLAEAIAAGRHGTMAWMEETAGRRGDPRVLWPEGAPSSCSGSTTGPTRTLSTA